MRFWFAHGPAFALAGVLFSSSLIAQDARDLPPVSTLQCGKDCQTATDPKPVGRHSVECPGFMPDDYPTEGLVLLRATVAKDGSLKDLKLVRVVGPQIFATNAIEAVKDWRYQPATRAGVPVDRPNWEIMAVFRYRENIKGARDEVYRIVRTAVGLSGEGKHAESIAMLLPVLSKPHLSFYEREIVCLQLSIAYGKLGDLMTAREYLDDATLVGDGYLSSGLRPKLWRMVILTDTQTGQLLEAKQAFDKLNAIEPVAADDPIANVMHTADEQIRSGKVLTADQRISTTSVLPQWRHQLMRHNFALLNARGKLDRLTIMCGEHLIESVYADKAEWHIPKSWEKCVLDIYGAPGTTFTLAETDD
jgi:TonB family protein